MVTEMGLIFKRGPSQKHQKLSFPILLEWKRITYRRSVLRSSSDDH